MGCGRSYCRCWSRCAASAVTADCWKRLANGRGQDLLVLGALAIVALSISGLALALVV